MSANRSIELSRQLYRRLLYLYPKEHRLEYGLAMTQLFTDQARTAHRQGGWSALLALWMRTLLDLAKSALVENFSSPQARAGLLQATPGSPLPWKGVLLVLIPGLVIFVSQLGQLAGKGWFLSTLAWAGYAFIVPVLLVWWRTGKFPVWGLVPLGLLLQQLVGKDWYVNTLVWTGYALVAALVLAWPRARRVPVWGLVVLGLLLQLAGRLPGLRAGLSGSFLAGPWRALLKPLVDAVPGSRSLLAPLIFAVLLAVLGWRIASGGRISGPAGRWFGVYCLLLVGKLVASAAMTLWNSLMYMPDDLRFNGKIFGAVLTHKLPDILEQCSYDAYLAIAFLLLVLLSAWLARRHGALAFLLPLGYLLPTIVYGATVTGPGDPYFAFIAGMVFLYRISMAVIAPVWIARSVSRKQQSLAVMVPIVIALAAQIWIPIAVRSIYTPPEYILRPILDGLMVVAGSFLALALYRAASPQLPDGAPPAAVPQELLAQ